MIERAARSVRKQFPDAVLSVGHLSRQGGGDLDRHAKLFAAYSAIFPFVWTFSRLDALLPGNDGYRLLLTATRKTS